MGPASVSYGAGCHRRAHASVCGVQKEPAFIQPVNLFPCPQIPSMSRQTPFPAVPAMNMWQHRALDHPPWPETCISESIPQCTWQQLPLRNPVLLQKGSCRQRLTSYETDQVAIFACRCHMSPSSLCTVFNVIGLPMLLWQPANNRMVVTELTNNSFVGHARIEHACYSPLVTVN